MKKEFDLNKRQIWNMFPTLENGNIGEHGFTCEFYVETIEDMDDYVPLNTFVEEMDKTKQKYKKDILGFLQLFGVGIAQGEYVGCFRYFEWWDIEYIDNKEVVYGSSVFGIEMVDNESQPLVFIENSKNKYIEYRNLTIEELEEVIFNKKHW